MLATLAALPASPGTCALSFSKPVVQICFLVLFGLSRLTIQALGVAPDPAVVVNHWQHVDLAMLASDPIGTLWALHAQPPLWNGVLAIATAVVGPDGDAVTQAIVSLNTVMSACAGLMLMSMLGRLGFGPLAAGVFVLAAMCTPTVIYYELLAFYPHFTFFLIALLAWLLQKVRREGPLWPVASALGVLVALSWTWAMFHPAFIGVMAAMLVWWSRGWVKVAWPAMALASVAFAVSTLPSVKNFATYGIPSASTWIGMNLAQTIPGGQSGDLLQCDFATAHAAAAAKPTTSDLHPLLSQTWRNPDAPNMNHVGMVATSKACLSLTKDVILRDPVAWLFKRIDTMLGSHQLMQSDYDSDPIGWNSSPLKTIEQAHDNLGVVGRSGMILWYLTLWAFAISRARNGSPFYIMLLLVMSYFTLASHMLNGGEQGRMRYTLEPIYLFLTAGAISAAASRYRIRAQAQGNRVAEV